MTALDPRLLAVAESVRPGARVADVGCDHGKLICHLVQSGRCPSGVACDLREGPLLGAAQRVRQCGLSERVSVRLCDGLDGVSASEADDVVIAGMGGETIAEIVVRCSWRRDPEKRWVLQPQTKAEALRRALWSQGFRLESERAGRAGRFWFTVLTARYDGTPREADEAGALCGLLPQSAAGRAYLRALAARLFRDGERALRSPGGAPEGRRLLQLAGELRARAGGEEETTSPEDNA